MILDPFAGIGTTANASALLDRRFVMIEINEEYAEIMKKRAVEWLGEKIKEVNWVNLSPPKHLSIQRRLV